MASRWAQIFDVGAAHRHDGTFTLALRDGELRFVAAGSRGEGIAAFTLRVSDPAQVLARARALALPTDGSQVMLNGARLELLGLSPSP